MNEETNIPGMEDPRIPPRAVSVYGQGDAMDDFPVLKAFQQYIDAEQAKARKRITMLAIFFGAFTFVVIAIFVSLLLASSERNQKLNDRILEYVMKERSQTPAPAAAPVVVQSPAQQDNAALMAMTTQLEEMRKQLQATEERTQKAEKAAKEAAQKAAEEAAEALKPKAPSAEELEIQRLRSLLSKEREALAAEKERRRQDELEAYRRKHYPELYRPKQALPAEPEMIRPKVTEQRPNRRIVDVKPTVHEEKRPVVEEKRSVVEEKRPVVEEKRPVIEEKRTVVEEPVVRPTTKAAPGKNAELDLDEIDEIINLVSQPTKPTVPTEKTMPKTPSLQSKTVQPKTVNPQKEKPQQPVKEVSVTIEGKEASWRIPD